MRRSHYSNKSKMRPSHYSNKSKHALLTTHSIQMRPSHYSHPSKPSFFALASPTRIISALMSQTETEMRGAPPPTLYDSSTSTAASVSAVRCWGSCTKRSDRERSACWLAKLTSRKAMSPEKKSDFPQNHWKKNHWSSAISHSPVPPATSRHRRE